ncbi:CRISPR-associated helicase Cas3' [Saccharopolyspora sp. NPDC047091]|uniref:CRISPR-associated helicase Cas3' n=1 Tax=Saccharopolyspora sp. NPDC047091 TaxID=3155924 RepID=UPI0033C9715F
MADPVVDLRLWGKERGLGGARYPVVCHGLDAAAAVRALWRDFLSAGLRRRLAAELGLSESETCSVLEFWAALHDIGKISPSFALQLPMPPEFPADAAEVRIRHDQATNLWLPTGLGVLGYPSRSARSVGRLVAQLLGGHHGRFHSVEGARLMPAHLPSQGLGSVPVWEAERAAMLDVLAAILQPSVPPRLAVEDAVLITGLVVVADWLVSQADFVREQVRKVPAVGDVPSLRRFFKASLSPARQLVRSAGLFRLKLEEGDFGEEFPGFSPNALQADIAAELRRVVTGPGLLMVAAPMGFGKTETALHAARIMGAAAGTSGIFVALPTMATADQMFSRVGRYVQRRSETTASQTLLHGMAWLSPVEEILAKARTAEGIVSDAEARVHSSEWLRGAKRGLLAGVGVGTIDQALLAVLPVRHNALRMFSLAGKTVIIDEVHAFDSYMRKLLRELLGWLGELGVPVVLLSATLPKAIAKELSAAYTGAEVETDFEIPYPGWRYVERGRKSEPRAVSFPVDRRRPVEASLRGVGRGAGKRPDRVPVLQEVLAPVIDGGCAVVICTTVAQAQQTFSGLSEWAARNGITRKLLHARFPSHQRATITEDVLEAFGKPDGSRGRPQRTILVATQVVEQSLDVDFDLVVTDLAPIELLLQRAGRLQRHPGWDDQRPAWADPARGGHRQMVVLTAPDLDLGELPRSWSYIYPRASLIRAHELIRRRDPQPINIPEDVQDLVDRGNPGDFPVLDDDLLTGFAEVELERSARCMIESQTAQRVTIRPIRELASLAGLSEELVDEEQATTRFNADSVRVLPVFIDGSGELRLGHPAGERLPIPERDRLSREEAIAVMRHTIPAPGSLVRDRDENHTLPEPWHALWPLSDLVALPHRVDDEGNVRPARVGRKFLLLDPELGLCDVAETTRLSSESYRKADPGD